MHRLRSRPSLGQLWLHQGDRDTLRVHSHDNPQAPLQGIFTARSADRPNAIGLHRVRLLEIASSLRLLVERPEAIDGTPVVDVKPVLAGTGKAQTCAGAGSW